MTAPGLVLIGPPCVGKTEVGTRVSAATGLSFVDLDDVVAALYDEVGWSQPAFERERDALGADAAYRAFESAAAHAVTRVLESSDAGVVALGAGHSHFTSEEPRDRVREALRASGACVVLLLPDENPQAALTILRERVAARGADDYQRDDRDLLEQWVTSAQHRDLATDVVVTGAEAAEVTAARVAALLGR